jgi:hypothetical protein
LTYLHRDTIGSAVHIRCGEAQQTKARVHEGILAAVVIDQPIPMVASVVFDCQSLTAIKQVWARNETALVVIERSLNLWPWESAEHEEHA